MNTVQDRSNGPSGRSVGDTAPSDALTLGDVFDFVVTAWSHHARAGILVGLAILTVTAAYILLAPKKYQSNAQLYVRVGRESVTLDPTATTGETFAVNSPRENEINSVVEILSSYSNFSAVVQRHSPELVLEDVPFDRHATEDSAGRQLVSLEMDAPTTPEEQLAITALQKRISIDAVRRANVINASCVAGSPDLAQRLLQSYLEVAVERHMRASRAAGSFEFFRGQTDDVASHYEDAARELAEIKSRVGVSSLEERRRTLQVQLSTIETQLATTEAELSEAEGTVEGLVRTLETVSPTATALTSGQPQDALGEAERRRNLLAIEERELLAKFTARHPAVVAVREQIEQADTMLDTSSGREQAVKGANPTYTEVSTLLATEKADVFGLTEKRDALVRERAKAVERLAELNRSEAQIAGLEERVAVLRKTSGDYTKKLEQARIDRALELERLSNITISQPPTFEPKAVSPKRRLAAIAGLVLACFAGLSTILLREWLAPNPKRLSAFDQSKMRRPGNPGPETTTAYA